MTQQQNPLASINRIVIKVGSALVTDKARLTVRKKWLTSLAEDIAKLHNAGKEIIVVCSGATTLGRKHLTLTKENITLPQWQAAAACGQIQLMAQWQKELAKHQIGIAQLLLTHEDSEHRQRFINARNTLDTLLENRIVPIINENDTVALAELKVGDNDRLSARVAQMVNAGMLVLLSDIDGLYTADPHKDEAAEHIAEVKTITDDIMKMGKGARSATSYGGMRTKLEAAKIATQAGCHMIICKGTELYPLSALAKGGLHTHFYAEEHALSARKEWIIGRLSPTGSITLDAGAVRALTKGSSLLPVGVAAVEGQFARGDVVWILNAKGEQIGKGLTAYHADDARKIKGLKGEAIAKKLGFKARDVLIHRDDMVLLT